MRKASQASRKNKTWTIAVYVYRDPDERVAVMEVEIYTKFCSKLGGNMLVIDAPDKESAREIAINIIKKMLNNPRYVASVQYMNTKPSNRLSKTLPPTFYLICPFHYPEPGDQAKTLEVSRETREWICHVCGAEGTLIPMEPMHPNIECFGFVPSNDIVDMD